MVIGHQETSYLLDHFGHESGIQEARKAPDHCSDSSVCGKSIREPCASAGKGSAPMSRHLAFALTFYC